MLEVEGAVVRYGSHAALDGVDLEVGPSETVVVLGPSGCGKSTLLRAVAGLEPLVAGQVRWHGADLDGVAPHERRFGVVFQDYALFPHRDVRGNVEFGLRMANVAPEQRAERVAQLLRLVGLEGYDARRVATLSGGEQQRVALARALAPQPRLLMFDEPLGALDRALRERLLDELRALLETAGLPALYVTHDHGEAFALADRLVVMRAGRVVQAGPPEAVWQRPVDEWTATFLGFGPAVDAPVVDGAARTAWGDVPAPGAAPAAAYRGASMRAGRSPASSCGGPSTVTTPRSTCGSMVHRPPRCGCHRATRLVSAPPSASPSTPPPSSSTRQFEPERALFAHPQVQYDGWRVSSGR
jgi:thiamine transport system ATP-binding protein